METMGRMDCSRSVALFPLVRQVIFTRIGVECCILGVSHNGNPLFFYGAEEDFSRELLRFSCIPDTAQALLFSFPHDEEAGTRRQG